MNKITPVLKTIAAFIIFITINNIAHAQVHTAKPPMGWNSWNSYGKYPTEKAMLANIQTMAEKLKSFGYNYIVLDAGWDIEKDSIHNMIATSVDEWGRYIPAKTAFPNGLTPVISAAHKKGFTFGIHIMRGIPRIAYEENLPIFNTSYTAKDIADTSSTCRWNKDNYGVNMSKDGAQAYYDSYIALLAGLGVDFIKADDITGHPDEVKAVQSAIQKTGKNIVLSISPGGDSKPEYIDIYKGATMLRITSDVWDNQKGIDKVFDAWKKWNTVAHDSLWLDMDMLPFGHICMNNADANYLHAAANEGDKGGKGKERIGSFTKDQQLTFITQRALGASPLFMGGDLPTTDEATFSIITNKEMIACDQNGIVGKLVYNNDSMEVWKTPAYNNTEGWIGIFNRSSESKNIVMNVRDMELKPCTLFDIWNNAPLGKKNIFVDKTIAAHGVLFCRYKQ